MAEVFAEDAVTSSATLDDRRIEELSSGRNLGAGIRGSTARPPALPTPPTSPNPAWSPPPEPRRVAAKAGEGRRRSPSMHRSTATAPRPSGVRRQGPQDRAPHQGRRSSPGDGDAISQVQVACGDGRRRVLIANSEGLVAQDDQIRTRFSVVSVAANGDTGMQTGYESLARTEGYEIYKHRAMPSRRSPAPRPPGPSPSSTPDRHRRARSTPRRAAASCSTRPAGTASTPASVERRLRLQRQGRLTHYPLVTLVDDGTVLGEWGNFAVDDEGNAPPQRPHRERHPHRRLSGSWLGPARKDASPRATGGARVTSTSRWSGAENPDEIVAQTPHGVFVKKLGGGQVNTATGDFVFGTTEAYLIENGRITEPLRDANLIGDGRMRRIDAVATDFDMTPGTCGKDQSVPGRLRPGHPAHRRGHGMTPPPTTSTSELLDLATDVVGRANKSEGLEVYVARGTDTEVGGRGRVPHVRPLVGRGHPGPRRRSRRRVGFAWAGSLDPDVIGATLADAHGHTTRPDVVLATPDGVTVHRRGQHPHGAEGRPRRRARRATRAADPRVRPVSSADYSDSRVEVALLDHRHLFVPEAYNSTRWMPARGKPRRRRRRRLHGRSAVRAISSPRRPWTTARCSAPSAYAPGPKRHARRTVVFDRVSLWRDLLRLVGEAVVKGVDFAGRIGETVATPSVTLVDDPTNPLAYGSARR